KSGVQRTHHDERVAPRNSTVLSQNDLVCVQRGKSQAGSGVPEGHAGSSNTASAWMEAQSECALRVVVRRTTLQRRRLANRGILEMGRIGRGWQIRRMVCWVTGHMMIGVSKQEAVINSLL
ncbi:unnamed protein product, partial [Ascophyllum nodosum]